MRGKDVDDTVDGLGGVLGVEGGEDQVAGLGRGQGYRHRLQVTQFADQDNVRVLPQHMFERCREAVGVVAHLALVDERHLMRMQELDRVLHRHDVVRTRTVDEIDHRRQRRRFAGAGGPGHQHQAARQLGEFSDLLRDPKFRELLDLPGDQAERCAERTALLIVVHPEPGGVRERVGEVELQLRIEDSPLLVGQEAAKGGEHLVPLPRLRAAGRPQPAVHADHRRGVDGQVKVRRPLVQHRVQGGQQVGVDGGTRGLINQDLVRGRRPGV